MAILNSTSFASRFVNKPAENLNVRNQGGRVRRFYEEYTIPAGVLDGDIIKMLRLPKGAVISRARLIHSAGLGAATTLSLGHGGNSEQAADDNAFINAVDSSTVSDIEMGGNLDGYNLELAEATDIQVEVGGADFAGGATGEVIKVEIYAVID